MQRLLVRPKDLVDAGLFPNEEEAVRSALVEFLENHPDMRIALAAYQYEHQPISIGAAAERAGVTRWEMMDYLVERGIELRFGPTTIEEARRDADVFERLRRARPD